MEQMQQTNTDRVYFVVPVDVVVVVVVSGAAFVSVVVTVLLQIII